MGGYHLWDFHRMVGWAKRRGMRLTSEEVDSRCGPEFVWLYTTASDLVRYGEAFYEEVDRWLTSFYIAPDLHDIMVEHGYETSHDGALTCKLSTSNARIRVWLDSLAGPQT